MEVHFLRRTGAVGIVYCGKGTQMIDGLTLPRLQYNIVTFRWEIGRGHARRGIFQLAQFAQLLGRHGDLMWSTTAENGDCFQAGLFQKVERVADDIAACKFLFGFGQDSRHVESNIAHADNDRMSTRQIRVQRRKIRVAIIPSDKGRTAKHIAQFLTGNVQRAIIRRAGCEDHRVVKRLQFFDGYILANRNISDKADIVGQCGFFIPH